MNIELLEDNLDETIDKIVEDETRRAGLLAFCEGFLRSAMIVSTCGYGYFLWRIFA